MTLRGDIQTALRAANDLLGEAWQYRQRTSGPAADTHAYGSYANVTANPTQRQMLSEWDDRRRQWKRSEKMKVRISDAVALRTGDQLKDSAGLEWAVVGIASHSPNTGTVAWEVERDVPLRAEAGPGRDGGL
jgi:hypothetical protein